MPRRGVLRREDGLESRAPPRGLRLRFAPISCLLLLAACSRSTDGTGSAGGAGGASAPRPGPAPNPSTGAPEPETSDAFLDVASRRGVNKANVCGSPGLLFIFENIGSGAAILDYDRDGRLDLYVNNAGTTRIEPGTPRRVRLLEGPGATLWRQTPEGRFEDATERSGTSFRGWGTGVAVGDLENDGDLDIFVGAYGRNRLFVNQGDGGFRDGTAAWGLEREGYSTSAIFVDYDLDGFLDLYVVNYVVFDLDRPPNDGEPCLDNGIIISCGPTLHPPLEDVLYRNRGDGSFEDVTERAGLGKQPGAYGLGVAAGDFDRDGLPDIYVTNDTQANFHWHNLGGGRFEEMGLLAGTALSETGQGQSGMGVDVGDVDGDGWLDIQVSNYSEEANAFYRNLGDGTFADESARSGIARMTFQSLLWGTKLLDYDHDGILDLFLVGGHVHPRAAELAPLLSFPQTILVLRGAGKGNYEDVSSKLGRVFVEKRNHRALAAGDVDGDGDLDLLVTLLDGLPLLLENRAPKLGTSVAFVLEGTRSNREGIGARIDLRAGGKLLVRELTRGGSYLAGNDVAAHFGIPTGNDIESVEIRWPSGTRQALSGIRTGKLYLVREGEAEARVLREFAAPASGTRAATR